MESTKHVHLQDETKREITGIHGENCLGKRDHRVEEHRIRPRPKESGGGRWWEATGAAGRLWGQWGRTGVEERAGTASQPVAPYIGLTSPDRKFRFKVEPEIPVPTGNSDPDLDRKFRLPAVPKLPRFKETCVQEKRCF